MAGSFKMYRPASKAGKAKHHKWDRFERFSKGHDASCLSLLPEGEILRRKNPSFGKRKNVLGVYRSPTFGMSKEDRMKADAAFLLASGRASTLDDAIQMVASNYND